MSDTGRLLFGAGFVFGVMFAMIVLAVVTVTVAGDSRGVPVGEALLTIVAGAFFAGVVGVTMFMLAFPENRVELPFGQGLGRDESEER